LLLFLFLKFDDNISNYLGSLSLNRQILFAFLAALGIVFAGFYVQATVSPFPDPASWATFSNEARNLANYFTLAGAFFGAATGYALIGQSEPTLLQGSHAKKLFGYLLGMIILLAIWQGLDILFASLAEDESSVGYILRLIRYAATTLWATWLAPLFFARLGMAKE
jgi:hypothetical protein